MSFSQPNVLLRVVGPHHHPRKALRFFSLFSTTHHNLTERKVAKLAYSFISAFSMITSISITITPFFYACQSASLHSSSLPLSSTWQNRSRTSTHFSLKRKKKRNIWKDVALFLTPSLLLSDHLFDLCSFANHNHCTILEKTKKPTSQKKKNRPTNRQLRMWKF